MKSMLRKFEFKGKTFVVFPKVYYPADDSFLLAENLEIDKQNKVLDLGTGCGLLAIIAADTAQHVIAIDINPLAIKNTKYNANLNKTKVETLLGNLFDPIKGKFDLIIFNPPYLPSEMNSNDIEEKSWNGGMNGRLILDQFLKEVDNFLESDGKIQFVQSSLANIDQTLEKLKSLNFIPKIIARKKFFYEKLVVIKAWK